MTDLVVDGRETGGVKEITTVWELAVPGLSPEGVIWVAREELETEKLPAREPVLAW